MNESCKLVGSKQWAAGSLFPGDLLPTGNCLLLARLPSRSALAKQGRSFAKVWHAFLPLLLFFSSTAAFAQKEVPELWGTRIHDDAHVLQQQTIDLLERQLKDSEDSTSNQIAILLISSLDGDILEEYSIRVVEKWKLGASKNDNGVLLLVAVEDHQVRIEVGLGLEGVLTDAVCSQIIRNEITPQFRADNYDAGIMAGVDAIIGAIGGEYQADDGDFSGLETTERVFIGIFIFLILGVFTFMALSTNGCSGWGLYAFLIPFYIAFPWVVIGAQAATGLFLVYLIGIPILKMILKRNPKWRAKMSKWEASRSGRGGRRSGGIWSSGGGSSWSGGSSFSGGGGSFGGGGGSGRW